MQNNQKKILRRLIMIYYNCLRGFAQSFLLHTYRPDSRFVAKKEASNLRETIIKFAQLDCKLRLDKCQYKK